VRRFLKGDAGLAAEMAQRLQGSPDLYGGRRTTASVNFVTCHDGFTLADLVSYQHKHNEANGEENRDGANDNFSWNWGVEGSTSNPAITALRRQLSKNALAMLLVSQGVPMLLMGDEFGRSQNGNNNAYCQDNEESWVDWQLRTANAELFRFCQQLIAFRRRHPLLWGGPHWHATDTPGTGAELSWHGSRPWQPDWSAQSRCLAFMLFATAQGVGADAVYVALNMHWEAQGFELPLPPNGSRWHVFVNTSMPPPQDVWDPGWEPPVSDPRWVMVAGRAVMILVNR
jgi:glycogen operon protein